MQKTVLLGGECKPGASALVRVSVGGKNYFAEHVVRASEGFDDVTRSLSERFNALTSPEQLPFSASPHPDKKKALILSGKHAASRGWLLEVSVDARDGLTAEVS